MASSQSNHIRSIGSILGLLIIFISLSQPVSVHSKSASGVWNGPVNLSNSEGGSGSPSITADPSGVVHVVWNEELGPDERMILYSRLENGVWSTPIDIISNAAGAPVIDHDAQGYLHLVWSGVGGYWYSKAYAPQADSARFWSPPQLLVLSENYLGAYDLAVGEGSAAGTVCIIHAKQIGEDSGIYVTCSFDQGNTWCDRKLVYENASASRLVDNPRLEIKEDGSIYIVWVESNYPETFPPLGLRFASSKDRGETWSSPYSLANGPYNDPEIMIRSKQEIHVVWSGTGNDRYKFHSWSADDGKTWYPIWRNTEAGGIVAGNPALVEDSDSRLYWLLVGDIFRLPDEKRKDAFYFAEYQNNIWSSGFVIYQDPTELQNMKDVSAVVTLGNNLHTAVSSPLPTTDGKYQMDILYFFRKLDSPSLAATPLSLLDESAQTPVTEPTESVAIPSLYPTVTLPLSLSSGKPFVIDVWTPVVIGVLPIIALVVGIFLIRMFRNQR